MLQWKEVKQDNPSVFVDALDLPELGQTLVRVVSRSTQFDNKIEAINEFLVPTPKASKPAKPRAAPKPKAEKPAEEPAEEPTPEAPVEPKKGPGL